MRKDFLLFLSFLVDAGYILVPSKGNRRNGIAGAVREERPPQVKVH